MSLNTDERDRGARGNDNGGQGAGERTPRWRRASGRAAVRASGFATAPHACGGLLAVVAAGLSVAGCTNLAHVGDLFHGGGSGGSGGRAPGGGYTGGSDGGLMAATGGRGGPPGTGGRPFPTDGGVSGDRHLTSASKLDVLFMIDDSASMQPLQAKLATAFGQFVSVLQGLPGGLPDVHMAVISSSLGAGAFSDVPGCDPGPPGDDGGKFQNRPGCGLLMGQTYLRASASGAGDNFSGSLTSALGCLANLGDRGCGFEHQLESTRLALTKASNPSDPDNGGFLRDEATLAVIMLTNEDDCSVPADSQLFDTNVSSLTDLPPLGGLWSYRCNEFGHRCDQPLPHTAAGLPMTLTNCTSSETAMGLFHLTPVADFIAFLRSLKPDPSQIFVAGLMAPPAPYVVNARVAQLSTGGTELQPTIAHSCSTMDGTFGDPAVRLSQFIAAFGPNGTIENICASDFGTPIARIAQKLAGLMAP